MLYYGLGRGHTDPPNTIFVPLPPEPPWAPGNLPSRPGSRAAGEAGSEQCGAPVPGSGCLLRASWPKPPAVPWHGGQVAPGTARGLRLLAGIAWPEVPARAGAAQLRPLRCPCPPQLRERCHPGGAGVGAGRDAALERSLEAAAPQDPV